MTSALEAVLLAAHGTVDDLADLPEFLANIRHGHAAPPELVREVERRYRAIGGSPLNATNLELARKLEARLGIPVRLANRLFRPYPSEVLSELAALGARRVHVVPLAQYSAAVYGDAVRRAAKEVFGATNGAVELTCAPNWGSTPALVGAFASSIERALDRAPSWSAAPVTVLFSAHSLPLRVLEAGDPYEQEVRASAERVAAELSRRRPGAAIDHIVAFQSQGMSPAGGRPVAWLGPDLVATLEALRGRGVRRVLFSPIGFLADHVEILYDLDVEAAAACEALGLSMRRAPSLNAETPLVEVLESLVRSLREGVGDMVERP